MKIFDCVQGGPEWHACRCGVPSASSFDCIITTEGKPSKQREQYLYKLAGERVTGMAEETYTNGAMQRGKEMEAEARRFYTFHTGKEVVEVGFCLADGGYGASPDGLVSEDSCLEIKCPQLATHVGYLLENKLPTKYFQQTQGQLLVTERKYVDFISYYPAMKPLIIKVERDEKFIKVLRIELDVFCQQLEEITNKIR